MAMFKLEEWELCRVCETVPAGSDGLCGGCRCNAGAVDSLFDDDDDDWSDDPFDGYGIDDELGW